MVLNPRKCEFMSFRKTDENEVFTYHKIQLKIDEHVNFNKHKTNVCKSACRSLEHYREFLLFLAIHRKR